MTTHKGEYGESVAYMDFKKAEIDKFDPQKSHFRRERPLIDH